MIVIQQNLRTEKRALHTAGYTTNFWRETQRALHAGNYIIESLHESRVTDSN